MDQSPISRYRSLDFFARQVVEGFITGKHKSPFHGFSVEFSDYRQYNPGESIRNIDYRLYGRTDRLYVKQFEEETNLRCQLFIDRSGSMLFPVEHHGDIEHPNKLTFSAYAAAVLIELLHRQRDAFGLTLFGPDFTGGQPADKQEAASASGPLPLFHTPCRSSSLHQQYLLGELDKLLQPLPNPATLAQTKSAHGPDDLPQALHLAAEQVHRRSLVIVFTDAFLRPDSPASSPRDTSADAATGRNPQSASPTNNQEALFDALRHLRHNKHEVILFHTYDLAHEVNLDFDERPHLFIDLESGRQLKLQPSQVAAAYRQRMEALFADLRQRAMQYRVDYVPVDVALGFHQVILPFLLKRSRLG